MGDRHAILRISAREGVSRSETEIVVATHAHQSRPFPRVVEWGVSEEKVGDGFLNASPSHALKAGSADGFLRQ